MNDSPKRRPHAAVVITLVCSALMMALDARAEDAPAAPLDLVQLRREVSKAELRLRNLRVSTFVVRERWDAAKETWEPQGEAKATAWYDGSPGGKVKVEVEREILPWVNGRAPFSEKQYTKAFDGKTGYTLRVSGGPAGAPTSVLQGEITGDLPVGLEDLSSEVTGWKYSLYGVLDFGGTRLSGLIPDRQLDTVTVSQGDVGGVKCIQIVSHLSDGDTDEYDLDPARGYAVVRSQRVTKGGAVCSRVTVSSFLEAAPGVFYPQEAVYEDRVGPGGKTGMPFLRHRFKASRAVANDPTFDDANFRIKWPGGTWVEDKVNGQEYFTPSSGL